MKSRTCHLRSANDPKRTSRLPVFRPSFAIQGIELFIRQLDIDGGCSPLASSSAKRLIVATFHSRSQRATF